jgi:hypothetical protein
MREKRVVKRTKHKSCRRTIVDAFMKEINGFLILTGTHSARREAVFAHEGPEHGGDDD